MILVRSDWLLLSLIWIRQTILKGRCDGITMSFSHARGMYHIILTLISLFLFYPTIKPQIWAEIESSVQDAKQEETLTTGKRIQVPENKYYLQYPSHQIKR